MSINPQDPMKKNLSRTSNNQRYNLDDQALAQFNSGHYKEAIVLYKNLLHDDTNDLYQQQIAYCYWLRSLSFATRGMYKEAMVLWENQSQHIDPPYKGYDHYISWLIVTNNHDKIQTCLSDLSVQQLDKEFTELSGLLGLLIITGYPDLQQNLTQDSDLIVHSKIAQTALQSFQNKNFDETNNSLKKIPFRSAFRDFRTILKAALAIPDSPAEAASLLTKIPAISPYSNAASLLTCSNNNGSALIQKLIQFNHKQIKTLTEIKGLNKKQSKLVDSLTRQKDTLSDKFKFNLAIQFQSLCNPEIAQNYCQALLVTTYPAGKKDYKKNFSSLDKFEENRCKALAFEEKNDSYEAEHYWNECIKILSERKDKDSELKIALILRRISEHLEPYLQTECLIESLTHDPDDHACYLKILNFYSQENDDENYKQWLNTTIDKFPQDIEVLNLAIQTAMANKTYKKANQYTSKILKIDPVNTFAKQILVTSHLAHARRLIKEKKFHLVEKEIQQAEKFKVVKSHLDQAQLIRGLYCFSSQNKKQGLQKVSDALKQLNSDPVNSHFQATMEALLTGLPVATLLREIPSTKDYLLKKQELSLLIHRLKQYEQENSSHEQLHKALEKVKTALKKSIELQNYEENDILALCQILYNIDNFELLRHCTRFAQAKWLKPIWVYYRVYSDTNGQAEKCTMMQRLRLEEFQEQARQEKDHRALILIDNYLDDYFRAHPHHNMGFLDNLFSPEEEVVEDPMEILFDHIPEKVLISLEKKVESLTRKTSPEQLAKDLIEDTGDTESVLIAMTKNPDMFIALMLVKAANSLNIDIDVSFADVLEEFAANKKNNASPFPF